MSRTRFLSSLILATAAAACGEPQPNATADTSAAVASALPALPSRVAATDSGPAVRVTVGDSVRLLMVPNPGDQINALQPPVLETTNGRRVVFDGPAVTADSAYFVGDVVASLPRTALPVEGTLTTSYCRAGEKLCRVARRAVRVAAE